MTLKQEEDQATAYHVQFARAVQDALGAWVNPAPLLSGRRFVVEPGPVAHGEFLTKS